MRVRNHRIDDIWHAMTSNVSSRTTIRPRFLLMHYTTGWSGPGSRDWLLGRAGGHPGSGVSAHLVIDRDGTAWQICPFNRRSWHAGPSRFDGIDDLNSHAIGFEFANPGFLRRDGTDRWQDDYGHRRTTSELESFGGFIEARHARIGGDVYAWPRYTEQQIRTGVEIATALVQAYPIEAVIGHEEVDTRGWKTDPGPAFPMAAFSRLAERLEQPESDRLLRVIATRLNLRGGPGTSFERIDPPGSLGHGTTVRPLKAEAQWRFVEVVAGEGVEAGTTGWVHRDYLETVR